MENESRFIRPVNYPPNTPGQGLGLSLARELARAHAGDLVLMKSDAEWTVFALRIPLRQDGSGTG